jgi:heat shock protein HtpX
MGAALRPILAALVALAPGLFVWLRGRPLVRSADDPALPERLLASRQRSSQALAIALALLIVLFRPQLPWALPLLGLSFLAGGFPARKALFDEQWGLVAYIVHVVRLIAGLGGFWMLLMAAPALVAAAGSWRWGMAAMLAGLLLTWGFAHDRILLWLLEARPLERPDLESGLATIVARSTALAPRLFVVGPRGGRWANAFALPSWGRPTVAFTRTVLEEFDTDEVAAVFAHEQAHLEHFDRRRLLRIGAAQAAAVLIGTLGAAASLPPLGRGALLLTVGWPLAVAVALVVRLSRHRAHEAQSDRRGAELCGDPGRLARALVKLHALSRLPRRLALEQEHRTSHPSLASRLRALRALDASTPHRRHPAAILAGAAADEWLVLDEQRAHWLKGVPEGTPREPGAARAAAHRVRSLAYSELVELRLEPRGGDRHAVVATDRAGVSWSLRLAPGEGEPAQTALDDVDDRLAPTSSVSREYRAIGSLLAAAGALVALLGLSAAAIPGVLAVVLPHPGALAAFGAAALASALLSPLNMAPTGYLVRLSPALPLAALLLLGGAALALGWATAWRERAGRTRSAPWIALFLALAGVSALLPAFAGLLTRSVLRVHIALRQHPAGAILLLAAAAALSVTPRAWARPLAALVGLVAALTLVARSEAFAARFVRDPLWPAGIRSRPPVRPLRLVGEYELRSRGADLSLSASGRSWVTRRWDHGDGREAPPRSRLLVGSATGAVHEYRALAVALIDDSELLALSESDGGLVLCRRPHDPARPEEWRRDLPPLSAPRLQVDATTQVWRVVGVDRRSRELVRLEGGPAGALSREDRWSAAPIEGQWLASSGPIALGVSYGFDASEEEGGTPMAAPLTGLLAALSGGGGTRLAALDASGARPLLESQLTVQCDEPPLGPTTFLCRASDGSRTSFWSLDPASGRRALLGTVAGFAWPPRPAAVGGVALVQEGLRQDLYELDEDGLVQLDRPDAARASRLAQAAAPFDGGVGVLVPGPNGHGRLLLYARETGAATPAVGGER